MKLVRAFLLPAVFLVVIAIFFYFRVTPIINQTFPYTYDQGRDFLKAESIVRDHDLTLLGPTTGITGLYHGAWWYYFLSIPYILFNGAPQGFAIFIMITVFASSLLFSLFLKKTFHAIVGLTFFLLVAGSSYFILLSTFAISSVFTFPFILMFLYSLYRFLETKKPLFSFLVFFSLANIFEAEVPTGLFTISAFIAAAILMRQAISFFSPRKTFIYSLSGLIIPFLPRIASEVKNGLPQIKTLLAFIRNPQVSSAKSFINVLLERLQIFKFYFENLFPINNPLLIYGLLIVAIIGLVFGFKKLNHVNRFFTLFVALIVFFLFIFSCLYKNNFWANYYEGLSFYFAVLLSIGFYLYLKFKNKFLKAIPLTVFVFFLLVNFYNLKNDLTNKKPIPDTGLRGHVRVVDYLAGLNKDKDFCVRVYTPPVIPHTYNYVFSYYMKTGKTKNVGPSYVDNRCFYIIERDDYQFRIDQFRKDHIPANARLINSRTITDNVEVELWEMPSE
ncbi:hypothetical protein A2970_00510 [Candidatus Roizmanbacteria bacterium RIFCSPLOWO2_01_FULL_44_13]|uniref:Glycosyltransferase RgtA/B/C/D-like domain-containing protein n=1 Tax=Candidatus Roizmanbacteria bacterium RIFCSPLOWO2_01_FULL_44_13 TaxID=1802069 RepID=A0A1F7JBT6_9BACT|nr:MAG: hypothetical protein A2970_00510 [Candidatus Roizmanbacteria bacterium RIFCSPLOWO2_01_FULL_44_13]